MCGISRLGLLLYTLDENEGVDVTQQNGVLGSFAARLAEGISEVE